MVDEQRRPVSLVPTSWDSSFELLWDSIYYKTGGRIRQFVVGLSVVDGTAIRTARWSQLLSSSQARLSTETSPHRLPVLLRGWW